MTEAYGHKPVLLREVLDTLRPEEAQRIWDATLGLGGHAEALLTAATASAQFLGTDRDAKSLQRARERLQPFGERVVCSFASFDQGEDALKRRGFADVDVLLADLGVSSVQLDEADRGFSFRHDGPLDMRMDPSRGQTARELLETLPEEELARIFHEYGEEPDSRRLAARLVELRRRRAPRTTMELARFIETLRPMQISGRAKIHPATKIFQALRIAVNDELGQIQRALPRWIARLAPGGRLGVISFHSLEDRLVKHAFREAAKSSGYRLLTPRPLEATAEECAANARARSARLRVIAREEVSP